MNPRLILLLSATGVLIGLCSLMGVLPQNTELPLWAVLAVVFSIAVARGAARRFFLNGFLAATLAWILSTTITVAFFPRYLANNPTAAASFEQLPAGMPPRLVIAVLGILLALIYGVIVGGLSSLTAKIRRRTPSA